MDKKNDLIFPFNFLKFIRINLTSLVNDFIHLFEKDLSSDSKDRIKTFANGKDNEEGNIHYKIVVGFTDIRAEREAIKKEIDKLLKLGFDDLVTNFDIKVADTNDEINQMLAIDYKTYMVDDILTKVDRATMSVSLEGREPLLDYRLIEFVSQLPSNLKYKDGDKKWLLKQITHKYLPKEMMDRPKQGFGVPLTEWFRDELKEYFMIYLDEKRIEKEGLFNPKEIVKLRDSYLSGNKENVQKLWFLLMFEMWYEKWM